MKNILTVMAVILLFTGPAFATQLTTTLSVSIDVPETCTVSTTPVNFTGYDGMSDFNATGTISVQCSNNTGYFVTLDAGQHAGNGPVGARAISDGFGVYLNYYLFDPTGAMEWGDGGYSGTYPDGLTVSGTGTGTNQVLTVNGTLLGIGELAPAGDYSDSVSLTVYF